MSTMILGIDFAAVLGVTPKNPLQVKLSKATDSGVIDVPKDLFEGILEASRDAVSRRVIMMHLFTCFTKTPNPAKDWRRVHAALMLTQDLVLNFPVLAGEIAAGYYFDLLQQLSFLEHFEVPTEHRAQALVRSKARSVRQLLSPKLADAKLPEDIKDDVCEDTESTCTAAESDGMMSDEQECHDPLPRILKAVQGEWVTKKCSCVKISGLEATWSSGLTASLSADHEFMYLKLPEDDKEYHAYLRTEDDVLCWSDGDFWARSNISAGAPGTENDVIRDQLLRNISSKLHDEEWNGVLLPQERCSIATEERVVIHGVASVGHCDDTDTETESSEDETPGVRHKRGEKKKKTRRERSENSSLTVQEAPLEPLDLLA